MPSFFSSVFSLGHELNTKARECSTVLLLHNRRFPGRCLLRRISNIASRTGQILHQMLFKYNFNDIATKKPHALAMGLSKKAIISFQMNYSFVAQTSADGFSSSSPIALKTTSAMSRVVIFSSFSLALIPSVNMVRQKGQATAMLVAFT